VDAGRRDVNEAEERARFVRLLFRQERRLSILRDRFADEVLSALDAAAEGDPERPLDATMRFRALHAIDRAMDRLYGRFPGDPNAALWRLILEDARYARIAAYRASRDLLRGIVRRSTT
jgi:hypothetical protein